MKKYYILIFIPILVGCLFRKSYSGFNFNLNNPIDSVFYNISLEFDRINGDKNIILDYVLTKGDSSYYSINSTNSIKLNSKILPYKVFKIDSTWVFVIDKNKATNKNELTSYFIKNNLFDKNANLWTLYHEKFWFVKVYFNKQQKRYEYKKETNLWFDGDTILDKNF